MGQLHAQRRNARTGPGALWALLVATVVYAAFVVHFDRITDDAYIYFRYAKNLALGHGLRFNPTDAEPVEGFVGPLWVYVLAALHAVGLDIGLGARLISAGCGALLLSVLAVLLTRGLRLGAFATGAALLWLACLPTFSVWGSGGLASMPTTLALFCVYVGLLAKPGRAQGAAVGVAGAAAVWFRLDALALVLALLVGHCALVLRAGGFREDAGAGARRSLAWSTGALVAGVGALVAWRWQTFGELLPNVVHAKVGFGPDVLTRGAHYLGRSVTVMPVLWLVLGLAAVRVARRREDAREAEVLALLGACVVAALVLVVGGDFMLMFRFLLPALPFAAVLFALQCESLWRARGGARAAALVFALAGVGGALMPALGYEPLRSVARQTLAAERARRDPTSQAEELAASRAGLEAWEVTGRVLARHLPPEATLVRGAVGAVGYFSGVTIYDQYGLTDHDLAREPADEVASRFAHVGGHDKFGNLGYFEPRRPDYGYVILVPRSAVDRPNPALAASIFDRTGDAAYRAVYRPLLLPAPEYRDGSWFVLLAERAPASAGADHGWDEALLKPENLRAPRIAGDRAESAEQP